MKTTNLHIENQRRSREQSGCTHTISATNTICVAIMALNPTDFAADTIPEIIKIIFTLPNLRRAPNPLGTCAGFNLNTLGTDNKMYVTNTGNWSPWPGSLFVAVS